MDVEKEALDFIRTLQLLYLEQRDIEHVLAAIEQQTSWIGTGSKEICKSFTEAALALFAEKAEYAGGFTVTDSWYESQLLAENVCLVYGEFLALPNENITEIAELHQRVSAICAKTNKGMKLVHLHMSRPDDDQEEGEYYVKNATRNDHKSLRLKIQQTTRALQERNRELEILTQNIPGGVHRCKNDAAFTLISMSGGFLDLFGYTREEITTIFEDSFMNMIFEGDRASVLATAAEQLSSGSTVEFEYRVHCKNGKLMWVFDRGKLVTETNGQETFFCMMMDITQRKDAQEKLRLSLERHTIIMDQATDVIFEWDIFQDTIDFSSNWEKKFGYPPISKNISQLIPQSANIHPDDMSIFLQIMADIIQGMPYSEVEFRIRNVKTGYTWCRIRATTLFDSDNQPIKAVGVIVDIDAERHKSTLLLEQAQSDPLTKLYNKTTTQSKIEMILNDKRNDMLHALMIIDVDNFKTINDRFGHQCGDAVLANMALTLKKLFLTTDIIGRIGGDEFIVFMANIATVDLASAKAEEVVRIFSEVSKEFNTPLSCSVGVSLAPKDSMNYLELFRCADNALYRVKNNGKVGFAFYDKSMREDLPFSLIRTAINENIDNYEDILSQELLQYTFQMLYGATDIYAAIQEILAKVGYTYNVSRVYIFESSKDERFCSNTFEWCNQGICPEISNLQNLSYENDLAGFYDCFDKNGVFYCQNINTLTENLRAVLAAQGIVSVLQCFIRDDEHIKGYIGFDECGQNRFWTKDQVDTLTIIANMLSTFLIQLRLKEELKQLKEGESETIFI